jgi:hypothetical protein
MNAAFGFRFDFGFVGIPLYWMTPRGMQQKSNVFLTFLRRNDRWPIRDDHFSIVPIAETLPTPNDKCSQMQPVREFSALQFRIRR